MNEYYDNINNNVKKIYKDINNIENITIEFFNKQTKKYSETKNNKFIDILNGGLLFLVINLDSYNTLETPYAELFYKVFNIIYDSLSEYTNIKYNEDPEFIVDKYTTDYCNILTIFLLKHYKHKEFNNFINNDPFIVYKCINVWNPNTVITKSDFEKIFTYIVPDENHVRLISVLAEMINYAIHINSIKTIEHIFPLINGKEGSSDLCGHILDNSIRRVKNVKLKRLIAKMIIQSKCSTGEDEELINNKNYYLKSLFTGYLNKKKALELFQSIYEEVRYRPGNSSYFLALAEFSYLLDTTANYSNEDINKMVLYIHHYFMNG